MHAIFSLTYSWKLLGLASLFLRCCCAWVCVKHFRDIYRSAFCQLKWSPSVNVNDFTSRIDLGLGNSVVVQDEYLGSVNLLLKALMFDCSPQNVYQSKSNKGLELLIGNFLSCMNLGNCFRICGDMVVEQPENKILNLRYSVLYFDMSKYNIIITHQYYDRNSR
uniref:Secreted protein n=1 Tax=Heterorhabditis bacteriophora TaxID=37862 RepID=A0A1I7W9X7_HETBA